jgi:sporulation protein YlmC with PRC-barrel domain
MEPIRMEPIPSDASSVVMEENAQLIASDKVEGTAVYDRSGENLGSIHNVMIDKVSGQVRYAVMSFGGFLGIGSDYHPLPWKDLTYDVGLGGYVIDVTTEKLKEAPHYSEDELAAWDEAAYGRRVADYYAVM